MTTAEPRPDLISRLAPLLWAGLALLLASATPSRGGDPAAAPGGVRLLWFTSAHCGPCQQIRPHVERMAAERLPVFKVDTAARPDVMRRYGVTGVPTFVLEADGEEVWRGVGVPGGDARGTAERMRGRLTRALADARRQAPAAPVRSAQAAAPPAARARGNAGRRAKAAGVPLTLTSDGGPTEKKRGLFDFFRRDDPAEAETIDDPFAGADPAAPAAPVSRTAAAGDRPPARPEADPMRATVRIHVTDDRGVERGSGTVIASRPGRSVVLTCGHLFKHYRAGGRIRAESFASGAAVPFEATLIGFDPAADVGLIALDTPDPLPAAALSPNVLVVGDRVVSTGCDGGNDPTRQNHVVQSVNRFAGPSNFTCTGQPKLGRSGGGCFDAAGRVVGVVWSVAQDPPEGVYAGLPAIIALLEKHDLSALRPGPSAGPAPTVAAANAPGADDSRARMMEQLFDDEPAAAAAPVAAAATLAAPAAGAGRVEITCVIRSTEDPSAPSEILVINRATARTLALLRGAAAGEPTPTSLRVARPAASPPPPPQAGRRGRPRASVCGPAAAGR